jgi:hypothetical protein
MWQNIKRRIENIPYPVGAEIGVYQGQLSDILLREIPGLNLTMVDIWDENVYPCDPILNLKYGGVNAKINFGMAMAVQDKFSSRAWIVKKNSTNAVREYRDNFFDFVFIDGNHSYGAVKTDIIAWLPKVKIGGWICGHDYNNPAWPGVNQAVNERFLTSYIEVDSDFTWFIKVK